MLYDVILSEPSISFQYDMCLYDHDHNIVILSVTLTLT